MYNPACCCCFRCFHGKVGVGLVSFLDVGIGLFTLIAYLYLMLHYSTNNSKGDDFVFWYGVLTIPFTAIVSMYSSCKLIASLCYKHQKSDKGYLIKALIVFATEVLGWILPMFLVKDYEVKIDSYIKEEFALKYFYLLKLNPLTTVLFLYQLYTIFVVHFYVRGISELKKKEKQRHVKNGIQLLPITNSELSKSIRSRHEEFNSSSSSSDNEDILQEVLVTQKRTRVSRRKRAVRLGTKHTSNNTNFQTESFISLRRKCLQAGMLYEDPDFDVQKYSVKFAGRKCDWKRPFEISDNPQFVCDGVSRFDVNQGQLGNCYFVAALANLTLHDKLFNKVICIDDNFIGQRKAKEYTGICRFKFFFNGAWKEVIIDDRLPVTKGKLVFAKSMDKNEYWSPLVEKAFAKLLGSYTEIGNGGDIGEAMEILTGGKTELHKYDLTKLSHKIAETLSKGGLVCCGKYFDDEEFGLIGGHAYSITHITKIKLNGRKGSVLVIRIRNPWGSDTEWTGEWSDEHEIWNFVDPRVQNELRIKFKADGEFWFPFTDFPKYFDTVYTCLVD